MPLRGDSNVIYHENTRTKFHIPCPNWNYLHHRQPYHYGRISPHIWIAISIFGFDLDNISDRIQGEEEIRSLSWALLTVHCVLGLLSSFVLNFNDLPTMESMSSISTILQSHHVFFGIFGFLKEWQI